MTPRASSGTSIPPSPRRTPSRSEHGGATVEFAFIVPLFLVMLFGTIQYSVYFLSAQSGSSAARETVRRAAVGDLNCAQLSLAAQGHTEMVAGSFTVTRRYYAPSYTSITDTTPARALPQLGDNVVVRVQYRTHDLQLPLVPVPSTDGTRLLITETAIARLEAISPNTGPCG